MTTFDDARQAGFSEDEIGQYVNENRDHWRSSGFSDKEIDQEFTGLKEPRQIPQPFLDRLGADDSLGVAGVSTGLGGSLGLHIVTGVVKGMVNAFLTLPDRARKAGMDVYAGEKVPVGQEEPSGDMPAGLEMALLTMGNAAKFMTPKGKVVGGVPTAQDFTDAARVLSDGAAPAEKRQAVVDAYQDHGIHPAEVAENPDILEQLKGVLKEVEKPPPEKAEPLRSDLAKTGDPIVDAVLDSPVTRDAINNMRVDDTHDVVFGAAGSVPLEDPTVFLSKHFPRELEVGGVKFDPAEPLAIHENVEQHLMDNLIKGGMEKDAAYRVAHVYATMAEHAWYRTKGIDPAAVEAVYKPILQKIKDTEPADPPSNYYEKPYAHDTMTAPQPAEAAGVPEGGRAVAKPIEGAPAEGGPSLAELARRSDSAASEVKPQNVAAAASTPDIEPGPSLQQQMRSAGIPTFGTEAVDLGGPSLAEAARQADLAREAPKPPIPAKELGAEGEVLPKGETEQTIGETPPTFAEVAQARDILRQTMEAVTPDGLFERYAGGNAPPPPIDGHGGAPPRTPTFGSGAPPEPPPGQPAFDARPPKPGQPWFTYAEDKPWVQRASKSLHDWYTKNFAPDAVSDAALTADPRFAEYKSRSRRERDSIVASSEEDYQTIRKLTSAERQQAIDAWEGKGEIPEAAKPVVERLQKLLESSYWREKVSGSQAAYFDEYLPHIFKDPEQARIRFQQQIQNVGPKWFQKERVFETIRDAQAAGLRLKSDNIVDLVNHRLISGADMVERVNLLESLAAKDLVVTVEDLPTGFKSLRDRPSADELLRDGWQPINGPDGKQRLIAPDIQALWNNAVAAKTLWTNEGAVGSTFRGWMAFKTVWAPLKLGLSLFHAAHVLHIDIVSSLSRAQRQIGSGDWAGALETMNEMGDYRTGRDIRQAWQTPISDRIPEKGWTPEHQQIIDLLHEGGVVPQISEELKINAQRALEKAWDEGQLRLPIQALRRGMEQMQKPIFEKWIPALKVQAYVRDAMELFERRPDLYENKDLRGAALREIAKSNDNRFGEMNYGGLFWNGYIKNVAQAVPLSLGWNLGFLREFGGGLFDPFIRAGRTFAGETGTQEAIAAARSRTMYSATYMLTAMGVLGSMSYMFTGEQPEGLDWVFPRIGGKNADGTPRRVTNMFFTREIPMAEKHVQQEDSLVGGMLGLVYNKLLISPFVQLAQNRDYYGNEIWDPNGPVWKRGYQVMQNWLGPQLMPMSIDGAIRQQQASGTTQSWIDTARDSGLAILGFSPAPKYVEKTPLENFIAHQFQRYAAPQAKTEMAGERTKELGQLRQQIMAAKQREDHEGLKDLAEKWYRAGGTRQGFGSIYTGVESAIRMFKALPEEAQQAVIDRASPEEQAKYKPWMKSNASSRVALMMVDRAKAMSSGDDEAVGKLDQQIVDTTRQAREDGHITDVKAFQRDVRKHMQLLNQPELAAIAQTPKKQRRLLQAQ